MKTPFKLMAGTLITLLMSVQFASAQFDKDDILAAADILPDSVDVLYEYDSSAENPFEEFFMDAFKEGFAAETEDQEEVLAMIEEIFDENIFTLAMEITEESMTDAYAIPNMYFTFTVSAEDFDQLLTMTEENAELPASEEYQLRQIYEIDSDAFLIHLNDLVVITSTTDLAKALIDTYEEGSDTTLAKNDAYQAAQQHNLEDQFLRMYIDPSFVASADFNSYDPVTSELMFDPMGVNPELLEAIISEGVSIAQSDEGFDFSVYVEGDEEKLTELDMLFDKYNFTPSLYREVSGENVILFMEQSNASDWAEDMVRTFSEDSEFMAFYDEFTAWVDEETSLSFENDIMPVLEGNNLFAVHSSGQLIPGVTVIYDVSAKKSDAASMVNTINKNIQEKWEDSADYSYGTEFINTMAFYKHTFMLEDPEMELVLRFAVTSDGLLVASTHPDLASVFRHDEGMTANESFAEVFSNHEEVSSILYMSFEGLLDYVNLFTTELEAPEEIKGQINDFMAPWKDLYAKSYADGNKSWASGSLRVDMENIIGFDELFGFDDMGYEDYDFELLETPPFPEQDMIFDLGFCDVNESDWFYNDVMSLADAGIVQGYEDGCFQPNNEVTRAEFTKMAVEGADYAEFFPWSAMSDQEEYFTDTKAGQWYTYYINQAAAIGYVDGYEDGTFKPNEPITRAEAVQILYNMNDRLQTLENSNPFEDVSDDDWFYKAVGAAYNGDIVSGKSVTSFDPHANITRAESAKIVNRLYRYYWENEAG